MLKDFMLTLFGEYTPLVDSSGVVISGIAGVDFPYIFGAFLFCIVVFCFFKLLGVVLKW